MKKIVFFVSILISSMIGADVTNSIGMVFKEIPASKGMKSFYVAETEVTQAQWVKVMGSNPSFFNSKMYNLPVDSIDIKSVLEFIKRLNLKENTKAYRLLTSDEFEYLTNGMCLRADAGNAANFSQFHDYACVERSIVYQKASPSEVKSKQANKFGVFDLLGNVSELIYTCKGSKCEASTKGGSWAYDSLWTILQNYDLVITPGEYFERLYISHANKGYNQDTLIDLGFRLVKDKQ